MNLILVTKTRGKPRRFDLIGPASVLLAGVVIVVVAAGIFLAGYRTAMSVAQSQPGRWLAVVEERMAAQRAEIAEARRNAQDQLRALSITLGRLQARAVRLEALGTRLTQMADLEDGEFDFDDIPAMGGPEVLGEEGGIPSSMDVLAKLEALEARLADRRVQLGALEHLMMSRRLQRAALPKGRPITSGWLSSDYGWRTDPFTGRRARHHGIDFAGKEGSPVVAVAAGVVTWAQDRYGYGNLVEINHGNGYRTRYGHNKELLVAVGDRVDRGQPIALMGSTGRSTGPHVHFEVIRDGRTIDPRQFIYASNR